MSLCDSGIMSTRHFTCAIKAIEDSGKISYWKEALDLEESILIWGSLMNIYLKIANRTGGKHENLEWENLDLRSMFVSYSMCYFGSSYLSSLILNLPMKMDIMSPLTHGTLVNTNEKSCL